MSSVAEFPEVTDNAASTAPEPTPDVDAEGTTGELAAELAPESAAGSTAPAAAGSSAASAGADSPRALLKQLQQQFTAFRQCLPLAIGIDKQVIARLPNVNRRIMRAALGIHTGSIRYLRAMEKATVRYDLDGNPGAEVTDIHRQHAKELLQQRFKKEAERKKAERDAAAEEEANRKRLEKLQQLASKFSRR